MEYYYSYFAMNVGLHSNVNIENLTIDLINDQSNIFYGLCNFLSVVSMVRLTIKNCQKGMEVGSSSNAYCSIALFYDQPTFEGNTINITKAGMGSIISGLEGQ